MQAYNLVSVPYEITLLSNGNSTYLINGTVSVPYEITLLSNGLSLGHIFCYVSVPYEITLLSNVKHYKNAGGLFQYLMKLHYSQTIFAMVN